jgi:hypothetical protein
VLLEDEGEPTALVVAQLEESEVPARLGYRTLFAPTMRTLKVVYGGILGPTDAEGTRAALAALHASLEDAEIELVRIRALERGSPVHVAVTEEAPVLRRELFGRPTPHWRADVGCSYEEFLARRKKKVRWQARRDATRLEETYGDELEVRVFRSRDELPQLFADTATVHAKTYQNALGVGFSSERLNRRLTEVAMERGWFRGYVLYLRGKPVAFWHGNAYRGVFGLGPTSAPAATSSCARSRTSAPTRRCTRSTSASATARTNGSSATSAGSRRTWSSSPRARGRSRSTSSGTPSRGQRRPPGRCSSATGASTASSAPGATVSDGAPDVPRRRTLLLAGGGILAAVVLAVGASAALDRPATTVTNGVTVEGTKAEIWDVLTDLDGYDDWNPVLRNASGGTGEGDRLRLDLVLPGHDPVSLEPKVLVSRPDRKLWWQDRLVVPGLRDWEYEIILEPVENGRVLAVQQLRSEGLLSPFTDDAAAREALELIAEALRERVEAG